MNTYIVTVNLTVYEGYSRRTQDIEAVAKIKVDDGVLEEEVDVVGISELYITGVS